MLFFFILKIKFFFCLYSLSNKWLCLSLILFNFEIFLSPPFNFLIENYFNLKSNLTSSKEKFNKKKWIFSLKNIPPICSKCIDVLFTLPINHWLLHYNTHIYLLFTTFCVSFRIEFFLIGTFFSSRFNDENRVVIFFFRFLSLTWHLIISRHIHTLKKKSR